MSQTQTPRPTEELPPLPLRDTPPEREQYEAIPWTGITLVLAVIGLLLFMAVPMHRMRQQEMKAMQRGHSARMAIEELSRAIEAYHNDHGRWPGARPVDGDTLDEAVYEAAWLERQLAMFTNSDGFVVPQFLITHPWGPYLQGGIPANPRNGLKTICVLEGGEDADSVDGGLYGWIYDPRTGRVESGARTSQIVRDDSARR